jgi:hypothetical protein
VALCWWRKVSPEALIQFHADKMQRAGWEEVPCPHACDEHGIHRHMRGRHITVVVTLH